MNSITFFDSIINSEGKTFKDWILLLNELEKSKEK